jgi:hypothetical protein
MPDKADIETSGGSGTSKKRLAHELKIDPKASPDRTDSAGKSYLEKLQDRLTGVMFDEEGLPKISLDVIDFTAADTYLRCGKLFEFVYVKNRRRPPSVAAVDGTAHHAALAENNICARDKGKLLKPNTITELYVEGFRNLISKAEEEIERDFKKPLSWDEPKEIYFDRAKQFHRDYIRLLAKDIHPELVEESFVKDADLDGSKFKIGGKIDLTTSSDVIDYKVAGRMKSQADVDRSLQLSLYSWATRKSGVGYITFVKAADPYVAKIESKRSLGNWAWALRVVNEVIKGFRAGTFPLARPDAQTWWCGPKFCGFWSECRGKFESS